MAIHKNTLTKLKNIGLKRARMNANFLTGNLRYNAIQSRIRLPNGIELSWDGQIAHYWIDLEHGTEKMLPFFIVTRTITDFSQDIVNELSGMKTNKFKQRVNKEYEGMKRWENAQINKRYGNNANMMRERELQRQRSLMRVRGETY